MADKANRPTRTTTDTSFLQSYLDGLGIIRPTIHINGTQHPSAIVSVDLGAPLNPPRLSAEQSQELVTRVRRLTRDLFKHEVNIRVSFDTNNGICWSSLA